VGNRATAKFISNQGSNFRVTHLDDPVPRIPLEPFYHHIMPEYWITSKNDVPVTAADIMYMPNGRGDVGAFNIDFEAHHWYLNRIDIC
jgi:triacylglycerol lipase